VKGLVSVRHFSYLVQTPVARLYEIAEAPSGYYRTFSQPDKKNPAKIRTFREPLPELKSIQSLIAKRIIVPLGMNDCAHGAVKGKSARTNAALHCGQPYVVTLDVRQFFDDARHEIINQTLREEYGFGRDVAYLITRLCTLNASLPQGAPSSPALANLLLRAAVDDPLSNAAREISVVNSRYVDDIALSGVKPQALINVTAKLLSGKGLRMYRRNAKFQAKSKLKIMARTEAQVVTGLVVNAKSGPTVPRKKRAAIRAAIYALRATPNPSSRSTAIQSIRGRIAFIKPMHPGAAAALQTYMLETIAKVNR
jgi:RNA-directed DNA polymerase